MNDSRKPFRSERHSALDSTYPGEPSEVMRKAMQPSRRQNRIPRHREPAWPAGGVIAALWLALMLFCLACAYFDVTPPLWPELRALLLSWLR